MIIRAIRVSSVVKVLWSDIAGYRRILPENHPAEFF